MYYVRDPKLCHIGIVRVWNFGVLDELPEVPIERRGLVLGRHQEYGDDEWRDHRDDPWTRHR